jgi:hypothetical protein
MDGKLSAAGPVFRTQYPATYYFYLTKGIKSFENKINVFLLDLLVRDLELRSESPIGLANPLSI